MPETCASTRSHEGTLAREGYLAVRLQENVNGEMPYTSSTVDPVVLRAARSACARAASFNG